jgi:hypothetical protein
MAALKAQWKGILYSVLASVFVDVILHRLFAPRIEYDFPPSFFVEKASFAELFALTMVRALQLFSPLFEKNSPNEVMVDGVTALDLRLYGNL